MKLFRLDFTILIIHDGFNKNPIYFEIKTRKGCIRCAGELQPNEIFECLIKTEKFGYAELTFLKCRSVGGLGA